MPSMKARSPILERPLWNSTMVIDPTEITTEAEFETALGTLLAAGVANGVTVKGGGRYQISDDSHDRDIIITRVIKPEPSD